MLQALVIAGESLYKLNFEYEKPKTVYQSRYSDFTFLARGGCFILLSYYEQSAEYFRPGIVYSVIIDRRANNWKEVTH